MSGRHTKYGAVIPLIPAAALDKSVIAFIVAQI